MAGQAVSRWPQLSFLLMASSASTKSLTLSDFESITSSSFPETCVQAYDTPLANCVSNDFTGGKACSAACKDSVREAQIIIQQSCDGVSADSDSLLNRGQNGNLVEVLCRDVDEPQTEQPEPAPAPAPPTTTTTTAAVQPTSTLITLPKDNIMIETSATSREETTINSLNGPAVSSVNEDLATQSTLLAIDTEQPTLPVLAAPTVQTTSVRRPEVTSSTTESGSQAAATTPAVPAAGAIHPPSFGFMCASFVMSTVLYMVLN
ncbi:hypothetical protein ACJ41O_000612 [Fusarium nematophilum]